jgi:hypothetical protein
LLIFGNLGQTLNIKKIKGKGKIKNLLIMTHHVWDLVQYGAYKTSIPFTYLSLCHQGIPNLLDHI